MNDRNEQVLAVAVAFLVLCWIAVGLRVYCRVHVVKSFGPDDFSLVILQLVYTVYLISQLLGWRHGTGRHKSALSEADNSHALMYWFICELLYIACTCLLKVAAGQFLLRLAVDARHVWALRALMLSTALFGTAYFFMVLFQCEAPRVFWEESPRVSGKCWSDLVVLALTYAASAVNCLVDWCFGLMPVLVVRTLNMPRGTKALVACLTSFAAIASIATIVRMVYIPTLLDGDDFLFQTTDVALWSTVEVGIGIAALSPGRAPPPHRPLAPPARSYPCLHYRKYMRADNRDPRQQQQQQQQQQKEEERSPPLKLRPEETILHISSASGPPPASPSLSRFALSSWIEEGGRGSRSSSRSHYHHSRSNAESTTELADWGGGVCGGITKTTEVSQSQHRLDSLPRMDVMLRIKKAPDELS
ncbi:hypothetical protein PG993_003976 [Apiospora rasikravindrae]|uniref:Rhodopsin domain-containing protein n=1 Tax=Apiospora rasikravindrae TaxID=990691 RepID=A0ABR1U126_9PEZI